MIHCSHVDLGDLHYLNTRRQGFAGPATPGRTDGPFQQPGTVRNRHDQAPARTAQAGAEAEGNHPGLCLYPHHQKRIERKTWTEKKF